MVIVDYINVIDNWIIYASNMCCTGEMMQIFCQFAKFRFSPNA